jgi:hypothetical protein
MEQVQYDDADKPPPACCDKQSACPGCCDMCTRKCNGKKVLVSLFILLACFFGLIGVAEMAGLGAWNMLLEALGITDCGWLKSFQDKTVIW